MQRARLLTLAAILGVLLALAACVDVTPYPRLDLDAGGEGLDAGEGDAGEGDGGAP